MLFSVPGIYEDGKVRVSEDVPIQGISHVIITFLENTGELPVKKEPLAGLLSDLSEEDFGDFLECCRDRGEYGRSYEEI